MKRSKKRTKLKLIHLLILFTVFAYCLKGAQIEAKSGPADEDIISQEERIRLTRRINLGDTSAMCDLAFIEWLNKNYERANALYQRAALSGNVEAIDWLINATTFGDDGTKQDFSAAQYWINFLKPLDPDKAEEGQFLLDGEKERIAKLDAKKRR